MSGRQRLAAFARHLAFEQFTDAGRWVDVVASARYLLAAEWLDHAVTDDTPTGRLLDTVRSEPCAATLSTLTRWARCGDDPATLPLLVDAIIEAELSAALDDELATIRG